MKRLTKFRPIIMFVIALLAASILSFNAFICFADGASGDNPCDPNLPASVLEAAGCNDTQNNGQAFPSLIAGIVNAIISVAGIVAVVYVVIGGIKYTSAKGEPEQLASGKRIITYALIGLAVSALTFAIVNFAINAINQSVDENAGDFGGSVDTSTGTTSGSVFDIGSMSNLSKLLTNAQRKLKLTWKSSDPAVATVSGSGEMSAKKAGTTTITATDENGNVVLSKQITVSPPILASSVTISPDKVTIQKGKKQSLTATIKPTKATNRSLTWSSSNKKVATVDKKGTVKGVKNGTAKITVKTDNGKKDTITVTVSAQDSPIEITQSLQNGLQTFHQNNYTGKSVSCDTDGELGNHSCGIAAYLGAYYALTGKKLNYVQFAQEGCSKGFYNGDIADYNYVTRQSGQYQSKDFYENKYGVKVKQISPTWDNIVKQLKKGNVVINYVVHPSSIFTGGEHFVDSIAYREQNGGEIYVFNVNNMEGRSKSNPSNCHMVGCWYTKSEYQRYALEGKSKNGAVPGAFVMSKIK